SRAMVGAAGCRPGDRVDRLHDGQERPFSAAARPTHAAAYDGFAATRQSRSPGESSMNANEENKRPEEIERDLEQTRAEVCSTLDAIQEKLTPGQLMDQALDYWRRSGP